MIQLLNRDQLDEEKYNNCISCTINTRIYAYSWYLDTICDDWDVLIKDDYHTVMPLPKRKKYGIHYIYQAPWIQQLGIFSSQPVDEMAIHQFIKSIPKKYKLIDVFFNSDNRFSSKYTRVRNNYILSLDSNFEDIKSNYNKNRTRISKTDFGNFIIDTSGNSTEFLNLYKEQHLNYQSHKDAFDKLRNLLNIDKDQVNIWNVYDTDKIVAGLCWLKDTHRITYLVPLATKEAKYNNIPTFLVNELIKAHINSKYILDFEGSMAEGVAKFYKSFGAVKEEYLWYKRRSIW